MCSVHGLSTLAGKIRADVIHKRSGSQFVSETIVYILGVPGKPEIKSLSKDELAEAETSGFSLTDVTFKVETQPYNPDTDSALPIVDLESIMKPK